MIEGTDGRDDPHILVTVQDATGKPTSNSPRVTVTIESGPGDFTTPRTITFDAESDIPIRDGQAAIKLRSYEGGKSVIRALSPGLKDAVLMITTRGEPKFVAGKSPLAPDRPYVRFIHKAETTITAKQDVARNRPTGASSEAAGHIGSLVVDGDSSTFWSAANDQAGEWWQVDLEQPQKTTSVETTFITAGNYRYRIDASQDGKTWLVLVDHSKTESTEKVRTDLPPSDSHCQFLRITLIALPNHQPAAIADIKIEGKHWP